MKRPAFQFYAKDWRGNLKLRRCSDAAKGAWIEIMCVLHDSEEYGVARFPLRELVAAAGVQTKSAKELIEKGVLKGGDKNVPAYTYTPSHAGKKLPTVTLLDKSEGPMWYCSRFVRDEHIRGRRGEASRFTPDFQPPRDGPKDGPKPQPKDTPKPPMGERQGDGSAVAVASAVPNQQLRVGLAGVPPQPVDNPRPEGRKSNPRADGNWRHDPAAADRKMRELGLEPGRGELMPDCVRRIERAIEEQRRAATVEQRIQAA